MENQALGFRPRCAGVGASALRLAPAFLLVTFFGLRVLLERNSHSFWVRPLFWATWLLLLLIIFCACAIELGRFNRKAREIGTLTVPFILCAVFLWYFRNEGWAALATGVLCAAFFSGIAKLRRRSLRITVVGWTAAGVLASLVSWPNEQKLDLVILLGGIASTAQTLADLASGHANTPRKF